MRRRRHDGWALLAALFSLAGCRSCGTASLVDDPAVRGQAVPAALTQARPLGQHELGASAPWDVDGVMRLSLGTAFTPERVGETQGTQDWYLYGTRGNPGDPVQSNGWGRLWYISPSATFGPSGRAGVYRWVCTAFRRDERGAPVVTIAVDRLPDSAANPQQREGPIATGQVVTRWLSTAGVTEYQFAEGPGQRGSVVVNLGAAPGGANAPWRPNLSVSLGIPGGVGPEGNASLMDLNPRARGYRATVRALDATVEVLRVEFSHGARFRPGAHEIEASGPFVDLHVLVAVTRR